MRLNRRAATGGRGRAGWLGIRWLFRRRAARKIFIGRFLDHMRGLQWINGTASPGCDHWICVAGQYVFTYSATQPRFRVWTLDGQHKIDDNLSGYLDGVAAPQIVVTPGAELLVLDPCFHACIPVSNTSVTRGTKMTLLLKEADVRALLTMPMALEAVEESLRQQGNGELSLHPRRRLKLPDNALLHYMAAGRSSHDLSE